jgi:hypothetical protein
VAHATERERIGGGNGRGRTATVTPFQPSPTQQREKRGGEGDGGRTESVGALLEQGRELGLVGVSYAGGVGAWWRCSRGGRRSGRLAAAGGEVNGGNEYLRWRWWLAVASAVAASGESAPNEPILLNQLHVHVRGCVRSAVEVA